MKFNQIRALFDIGHWEFVILFVICFVLFGLAQNSFAATESIRTIKPSGQGGDYTTLAAPQGLNVQ